MIRNADSMRASFSTIDHLFVCEHNIDFSRVNAIPDDDDTIFNVQLRKVLTNLSSYP